MKTKLTSVYEQFFKDLDIDQSTGLVRNQNKRFATMPYVGENYEEARRKILFVGMDIGKDETHAANTYQDFNERRSNVCGDYSFNPHIAGTYSAALHFLKDTYNWQSVWDNVNQYATSQQATKTMKHKEGENPLKYIALTNFYKFVTFGRRKRAGDNDRQYLLNTKELEENLFLQEVQIFNPDIIVFQTKHPNWYIVNQLKNQGWVVYVGPHPSYREKGGRQPGIYVNNVTEV